MVNHIELPYNLHYLLVLGAILHSILLILGLIEGLLELGTECKEGEDLADDVLDDIDVPIAGLFGLAIDKDDEGDFLEDESGIYGHDLENLDDKVCNFAPCFNQDVLILLVVQLLRLEQVDE